MSSIWLRPPGLVAGTLFTLVVSGCASNPASDGGTHDAATLALRTLAGLPDGRWIESLAFAPDGKSLWLAGEDQINGATGEARGFELSTGSTRGSVGGPFWSVAFDPTGQRVALGGATAEIVASADGTVKQSLPGAAGAAAWSHDGNWIAAAAPGQVNIYSAADGALLAHVAHPVVQHERIWRVAFSPDDRLLLTASGQNGLGSPHGTTLLWHTTDWSQAGGAMCTTFDGAFSPDGTRLALACWQLVQILRVSDGSNAGQIVLPSSASAMGVAWSPDGKRIAVGGLNGGIHLYAASTLDHIGALTDGAAPPTIKAVAFSPDGQWIAGGGWSDSLVRLWPSP